MSLSTHVLDASRGRPAPGVRVRLDRRENGEWVTLAEAETGDDGRTRLPDPGPGVHRLVFDTAAYFAVGGTESFYPEVSVAFTVIDPGEHYHVPLLLSPYAYSTYRGS